MVFFTKLATATLLATSTMAAPKHAHTHNHSHSHLKRGGTKKGAAYNTASAVQPLSHAVSWAYDWNMYSNGQLPGEVEYVPMLWGAKMFGGWVAAIETALGGGSNYILGFNEPDMPGQSNMDPSEAVGYYQNYITPYAGQATLVSPSVTSSTSSGQGLDWLKSFMDSCQGCNIGGISVHWYGSSPDQLKSFVTDAVNFAGKYGITEVWLTEFALTDAMNGGNPEAAAKFLKDVLPWLDSQPAVTRYAYFMCDDGHLLQGSGLSASGEVYASS